MEQLCLDSLEISSATAMEPASFQVEPAPRYQQWCHLQAPVEVRDLSILLLPQRFLEKECFRMLLRVYLGDSLADTEMC